MASVEQYRTIIERTLTQYTTIPYAYGDIQTTPVFDHEHDRYLLVSVGWDNARRVHGSLVHIDIIDGKVWVQRDGTEDGIATELVAAGIPKEHIVLGFRAPEVRKYTEFAIG